MLDLSNLKSTEYGTFEIIFNNSSFGFEETIPNVKLIVDIDSKLPIKSQVIENDPLLGDVVYEVYYSEWAMVDGLFLPHRLEHKLDGFTLRLENLSRVNINPQFDMSELVVTEEESWAYAPIQAYYGYISSQFHFRTQMQSFPIDFPVEYVESNSSSSLPSELLSNDSNVYRVSGDFQSHYTYAFKVDESVLIYDSPINNRRSKSVLNKIRQDFSIEPIKYVVHSHNHFDHTGGIRGNLSEGAELVVGAGSKDFIEGVLNRPHTVLPNPIEGLVINVIGLENQMIIGEGDEQIILYLMPTLHAEEDDYILLYKPSTKAIFFNDMSAPGFMPVFSQLNQYNTARLIRGAKEVVNFVDSKEIEVLTYHGTHGFTNIDFDFQTLRFLANQQ